MVDSTEISTLPDSKENITLEKKEINNNVLPQDTVQQIIKGLQNANLSTSLPSRDIPMDTRSFSSPVQTVPNYVKEERKQADYIKDKEDIYKIIEEHTKQNEEKKKRESKYDELQSPFFAALLYLVFQLSVFQNKLATLFPSMLIKDGSTTGGGKLLIAILFGLFFYGIQTAITQLSNV